MGYLLLPDEIKLKQVRQLASITPFLKYPRKDAVTSEPPISLEVEAALTYNKRSEKKIPSAHLAKFYHSFFDSSVSVKEIDNYVHDNVSLIITWRVYSGAKRFSLQVVAALTFSRPRENLPSYLAYFAVSHGLGSLPSLSDTKVNVLPEGMVVDAISGYRGLGLGSLLLALLDLIRSSQAFQRVTQSVCCFLHYNTHNDGSKAGWLKFGFKSFVESSKTDDKITPEFKALVTAMKSDPIFHHSNGDTVNCMVMYGLVDVAPYSTNKDKNKNKNKTKNEYIPHDPDAWFKDYEPELQTKFKATKPSMPAYALDPDEMDAKYEVVPKNDDEPVVLYVYSRDGVVSQKVTRTNGWVFVALD